MCYLYLTRHGDTVGITGGYLKIVHCDKTQDFIPKATLDGISVFARVQLSTDVIRHCLMNGINISYFSETGFYYGTTNSIVGNRTSRVKSQVLLSEQDEFRISLARKIVFAKINNQLVVAKRYLRSNDMNPKEKLFQMRNSRRKVLLADSTNKIMGYEGIASRNYFDCIGEFIEEEFKFNGRNRRPARDPFNCMINFGYSLLYKEICGELENRGLNPYVGFMHKDKPGHASLASDLIEEWRAPIIDSVVLSLIQGHEIKRYMFEITDNRCWMTDEAKRLLINKIEHRMYSEHKYLTYISKEITYRMALWHQIERLGKAVDNANPELYEPVIIR
ncbi:MAG: CRISPR-associated endonuclease Cas1 [Clostridia bacterium]|nr:CRISPR-associated endonuclease Cas1 [Clostridia bacterium]